MHFPLHPETPAEGASLEALFAGRNIDIDAMYARMKALMDAEGLPYAQRTHTYQSRLAQELGSWAETRPGGGAIHLALFRAYFIEGLNIGDPEVLVEIAAQTGFDPVVAREVLAERRFSAAVDADWAKSRAFGVTGVPTFVAAGYAVVGAEPYATLEALALQAGASLR